MDAADLRQRLVVVWLLLEHTLIMLDCKHAPRLRARGLILLAGQPGVVLVQSAETEVSNHVLRIKLKDFAKVLK